jgi:sirohydrochlorin cobaltochelatase
LRRAALPVRYPCVNHTFNDAALLLIGHGSTLNADSAGPTYQHAAELRKRRIFARVSEAFWKQEPGIRSVLAGISEPRIFAAPLFISEGYFTEDVIPAELGLRAPEASTFPRVQRRGDQLLTYCSPVGTHPKMTEVILARAGEVVSRHPFPRAPRPEETALFIAGHGTDRNENSRRAIEAQAELIRLSGRYAQVQAVYMEQSPRIGDCYELARTKHIVMVPFFISDGLHSYEDIPMMLGEPERVVRQRMESGQPTWRNPTEKRGKLVWYARSVGTEPHLADVILERVEEAARMFPEAATLTMDNSLVREVPL